MFLSGCEPRTIYTSIYGVVVRTVTLTTNFFSDDPLEQVHIEDSAYDFLAVLSNLRHPAPDAVAKLLPGDYLVLQVRFRWEQRQAYGSEAGVRHPYSPELSCKPLSEFAFYVTFHRSYNLVAPVGFEPTMGC